MMKIKQALVFVRKLEKLCKRDAVIRKKVGTKLKLFLINQNHPSLRLHKITASRDEAWSLSVDMRLSIVFIYMEYGILLLDIGSHDEVY